MKLLTLLILLFAVSPVIADEGDETLNFYLSKADLVVVGKITSDPGLAIRETGFPNYSCEFRVSSVLKGDTKIEGQVVRVNVMRFESSEKDKHPLIKKDGECIFFLKKTVSDNPEWVTVDVWFGVQNPSPWMARSLKRLAANK